MVHTLRCYGSTQHPSVEGWRQRATSMDCKVPSSDIIPAVAARLKYYVDIERKEAGFDLSVNQQDSDGKHRLYQPAGRPKRHPPQRPTENLLDNKLEASLRSYTWKSGAGWNKKVEINADHKQQVQRRIREQMSSFTIPERFARNYVFLRGMNWKGSDWKVHSLGIVRSSSQAVSHGELERLISSAANLIVATTSEHHSVHLHQPRRESPLKSGGRRSLNPACVNMPPTCEEPSANTETLPLDDDTQSMNLGLQKNHTVPATSDHVDYEIAVHTTARFQEETTPSMFIRLYGESGRTKTLSLQNALAATITSGADRAFTFRVKTKDVGELTDLSMGINTKDKACIWYCMKVIVKKGTKKYIFPYNNWFSSCKSINAQVMGHVPAATGTHTAADQDPKNCQTKKDKCRPTTSKPQSSKNISCLVSSKKVEFHNGKLETSKKEREKDIDSWKINNKKSIQSPRTAEGNTSKTKTSIRRYGSSERRPHGIPSSKKAKFQVSSGKTRTSKDTSDQVPLMMEKHCTTIMSDGSKAQPLLGEDTMYNITSSNTITKRDLTIQSNIQPPKYRRASSPASYVFFALENKESSTNDQVNECTMRYSQDGSNGPKLRIRRRASSERTNVESQHSGEGKNYISFDRTSSQLALLQELLSNSGNNVTSGSLDSQPFSSRENGEETRAQCGADDEVHGDHTHENDYDTLCSQLDCAAAKTSGYSCSCGEHSGYETDSTLDEEYIFSDTSLDLSLSDDDDSDSSSKFDVLGNCPEYNNEEDNLDVMEKSKHQIHRQRRVESCSENSSVFQRSLAAINNGDDRTLRILCQSHFFLPSVTDEEGKTLLHHAAEQDNPSICQVLLDTNIGLVNTDQWDTFGKTALHYAVEKGNPKTIKTLMDNGANLEI